MITIRLSESDIKRDLVEMYSKLFHIPRKMFKIELTQDADGSTIASLELHTKGRNSG